MNILLTGGRGFLGAALAGEIERSFPRARLCLASRLDGDLRKYDAAERLLRRTKPRLIFHAAGAHAGSTDELWQANVVGTLNLLEAAAGLKSKATVLIAGSSAEYGAAAGRVSEEHATRPISDYGAVKLAQTLAALCYRRRGLKVIIARIFNLCGPGTPASLAPGAFARQIALIERGRQPPFLGVGALHTRRDYIDVRDAARALVALSRRGRPGDIYNVCSGRSHRIGEMLERLISLASSPIRIRREASRRRAREVLDLRGDGRKLQAAAGWGPEIPFERSLREMLDWHRVHLNGNP